MRIFPKRAWLVVLGLVLVMAVSACGGTTSTRSTPTTATSAPTTAPTPTTADGREPRSGEDHGTEHTEWKHLVLLHRN